MVMMEVERYDSNRYADCLTNAVNNCVQNPVITPSLLRLFSMVAPYSAESDEHNELPEVDQAMGLLSHNSYIGGPDRQETDIATFAPLVLHYDNDDIRVTNPSVQQIEENTQIYHTLACGSQTERLEKFEVIDIKWVRILPLQFYDMFLLLVLLFYGC